MLEVVNSVYRKAADCAFTFQHETRWLDKVIMPLLRFCIKHFELDVLERTVVKTKYERVCYCFLSRRPSDYSYIIRTFGDSGSPPPKALGSPKHSATDLPLSSAQGQHKDGSPPCPAHPPFCPAQASSCPAQAPEPTTLLGVNTHTNKFQCSSIVIFLLFCNNTKSNVK